MDGKSLIATVADREPTGLEPVAFEIVPSLYTDELTN